MFFGAFLLGETLIIPAAAAAAHGHFNVFAVAGWAYAGTVIADAVWFVSARPVRRFLDRNDKRMAQYEKVLGWVSRRFGEHPERALYFIKFIYGTRITTIVFLSLRGLPLRRFVAMNGAGAAVWIAVIVTVGWLAGRGIASLGGGLSRIEFVLPAVVVLVLAVKGVAQWAKKRTIDR